MARTRSLLLASLLVSAAALTAAPAASALRIESIDGSRAVTGTATTTFTDGRVGAPQIRCSHSLTIPTSAFAGVTTSVSIDELDNLYTSCRSTDGAVCTVRVNGDWTLTVSSTTSGSIRIESTVSVDCTKRISPTYSCVFTVANGQTLAATFRNPASRATTGSLTVDSGNTIRYTVDSATNCPLGTVGTRGTATMAETISTENVQIIP